MEISFARCLLYSSLLSLAESAILFIPLGIWDGIAGVEEARFFVVFLGVTLLVSLLAKAPAVAGGLVIGRSWLQTGSRFRLSLLNAGVYLSLLLAMLVPTVVLDPSFVPELPPGYLLYALACLLSPHVPWIRSPIPSSQRSSGHHLRQGGSSPLALSFKAAALILAGVLALFALMTNMFAPAA